MLTLVYCMSYAESNIFLNIGSERDNILQRIDCRFTNCIDKDNGESIKGYYIVYETQGNILSKSDIDTYISKFIQSLEDKIFGDQNVDPNEIMIYSQSSCDCCSCY